MAPHSIRLAAIAFGLLLVSASVQAQVLAAGQVVGTVQDPTGARIPGAQIEITDVGTGITVTATSNNEGGFVFPALQPGRYRILVTAQGFEPALLEDVAVETGRSSNVTVQVSVAGVAEQIKVVGRAALVETTSARVSSTVGNEQIAKLPLAGRNILEFALLTPGTATSAGARFSTYNGLPGGAISITLDNINNNSQRFRSGNTSFFVFAPVRLGAIEEVTVSTSGLTADAGAQGAVQVQFVTRRGTNVFRGQVFDQIRHDSLNANSPFNAARGIPKAKLRQHEVGGNLGGPLIRGKLFFFANYEQTVEPGERTETRLVLTPEAQQGVFRYLGTDGVQRTANLLEIASGNGFPAAIDPFIAAQQAFINSTLDRGDVRPEDLFRNRLAFVIPTDPVNLYPTGRIDFQARDNLAIRGVLNLHYRDLVRFPNFPGQDFINGGFKSTYYILSTGADWTLGPNLVNQFSFGVQSNKEEFRPGNSMDLYAAQGGRRIIFPLSLQSPQPTGDVMPLPRNNPVYHLLNTVTWLKNNHTITIGGTFRRTTMWESTWGAAAGGPAVTLGVSAADPVAAIFNTTTLPGIRSADLANALALYAFLTGRISSIAGVNNVDENTRQYAASPVTRREAQSVGGVYFQDSWRMTPGFTLNYGLRWEFTGAAYNTNDIYTSPTREHLLGPSLAPFQPGTFSSIADPQLFQQSKLYDSDFVNPAPNVGFAWNPKPQGGFWGRLLGNGGSVLRGSLGVNYYDEGLVAFQANAGSNPGLTQQIFRNPGDPGFPPGGLTLTSPMPPLATFPAAFQFPVSQSLFTFSSGYSTIDPEIRSPRVLNWSIGLQRELGRSAAVEIRYVGNRGYNLWRSYDFNEVNIFENGFLDEFRRAQRNLEINRANGLPGFANNGLPGQAGLPVLEAAFGARGGQPALAPGSGFNNGTFVTLLDQGQAGGLANQLAGNSIYLCRLVGSQLPACGALGYRAAGPYPINFFQANPFAAGRNINLLTDEASSRHHSVQLQYRQRYAGGLTMTANYTYGRTTTDRYTDTSTLIVNYTTLRDKKYDEGVHVFDLRHAFQSYWTYELPFGRGRRFNMENALLNHIAGGWNVSGILRIQSGRPFLLTSNRYTFNFVSTITDSGVVLNGVTVKDLQRMVSARPGPNGNTFFLDARLIGPDGRANPEFIRNPTTPGELGQRVFLYGPGLWNVDLGIAKRFETGTPVWINIEALFLNAFNHPNYLVGTTGFVFDGVRVDINSTTFGQTTFTSSAPRNIQIRLQVNF